MDGLDERIHRLVSDPEQLDQVLSLAQTILNQREPSASEQDAEPSAVQSDPAVEQPDVSNLLLQLLDQVPEQETGSSQTSKSKEKSSPFSLSEMLPLLLQMFTGEKNLIPAERVQFLEAVRPYLKENRSQNIDRALKMANTAKAAVSVMHMFGR